ncbi:RNA polymerase sigma-70 factor [Pseudobacter ginsenosidimutans]|uniref:RNA polymerase sigma-70 factor (ECF subfamily) n=1 Tax=Pseudobacter ginsenosidimutans TaxID=661488 RepID=A0A4Q7MTW1_9BACT|nr:RNA polymerase sigma-70 factor [Pseudobacter ginsenosidimutans]QEC41169.1 RNA polymerase sigma-70 factor [Pseudobacter ginsenosidimutans]RZS72067.1 RNA polymerase sigma-70 factor (ECF subfamily) [Pseudobacter ginsenosidimutans]
MENNRQHIGGNINEQAMELLFAELFRKHECRLYTLAQQLTKSEQYAKDVIQEVFIKLWERRQDLSRIENIEAWLYRMTENKVIDFLRKAAADGRLKEAIWKNLPMQEDDPEVLIETKEYHQIIRKAIESLPAQRKLIYQLNREKGLNYQEIAQTLQISKHTVKNQLSTALQSIRRFLAGASRIFFL